MNLEPIIQSEISQKEKNKYCILTYLYGIYKDGTDEPICKVAMKSHRGQAYGHSGGRRGRDELRVSIETYTLPQVKQIARGSLLCDAGSSNLVLWDNLEGWEEVANRREVQEEGNICMPTADSRWCVAETNSVVKQLSSN